MEQQTLVPIDDVLDRIPPAISSVKERTVGRPYVDDDDLRYVCNCVVAFLYLRWLRDVSPARHVYTQRTVNARAGGAAEIPTQAWYGAWQDTQKSVIVDIGTKEIKLIKTNAGDVKQMKVPNKLDDDYTDPHNGRWDMSKMREDLRRLLNNSTLLRDDFYAYATGKYRELVPPGQWSGDWLEVLSPEKEALYEYRAVVEAVNNGDLPALRGGAAFIGNMSYGGGSMQATFFRQSGNAAPKVVCGRVTV